MPRKVRAIFTCNLCAKVDEIDIDDLVNISAIIPVGWESFKGDYLCDNCVNGILSYVGKGKEISIATAIK